MCLVRKAIDLESPRAGGERQSPWYGKEWWNGFIIMTSGGIYNLEPRNDKSGAHGQYWLC